MGREWGRGRRWGGGKNEKREEKEIEKQEGGSAAALKRMLCLAVSLSFLFLCSDCNAHVFFSSYQLCKVLTTTESGLSEAQINHRN